MSAFMAAFKALIGLLNDVKKRAVWWQLFKLRIWNRKSSHKSGHKSSRAARTDEQQRKGTTTRNRVRQFPHSFATSHPAGKH